MRPLKKRLNFVWLVYACLREEAEICRLCSCTNWHPCISLRELSLSAPTCELPTTKVTVAAVGLSVLMRSYHACVIVIYVDSILVVVTACLHVVYE